MSTAYNKPSLSRCGELTFNPSTTPPRLTLFQCASLFPSPVPKLHPSRPHPPLPIPALLPSLPLVNKKKHMKAVAACAVQRRPSLRGRVLSSSARAPNVTIATTTPPLVPTVISLDDVDDNTAHRPPFATQPRSRLADGESIDYKPVGFQKMRRQRKRIEWQTEAEKNVTRANAVQQLLQPRLQRQSPRSSVDHFESRYAS